MKNVALASLALLVTTLGVGCGGSTESTGSSSATTTSSAPARKDAPTAAKSAEKPAEKPAEATATKLDAVGLTAMLPPGGKVMKGIGEGSAMITSDTTTLSVALAKDTDPKTVEQGKDSALLGDKGRGLKADKTADGWIVTWENTGSMGDNYWLTMRREIGGKGYMCSTTASKDEQRKAAIEVCNSLKP